MSGSVPRVTPWVLPGLRAPTPARVLSWQSSARRRGASVSPPRRVSTPSVGSGWLSGLSGLSGSGGQWGSSRPSVRGTGGSSTGRPGTAGGRNLDISISQLGTRRKGKQSRPLQSEYQLDKVFMEVRNIFHLELYKIFLYNVHFIYLIKNRIMRIFSTTVLCFDAVPWFSQKKLANYYGLSDLSR